MGRAQYITVALTLAILTIAMAWVRAQQRTATASLTPQDYIEIQQLYAAYVRALDWGIPDPDIFTADGTFVNITLMNNVVDGPKVTTCQAPEGWTLKGLSDIRGTIAAERIPEKIGVSVCIHEMSGNQIVNRPRNPQIPYVHHHLAANILIRPAPAGATGFATIPQYVGQDGPSSFFTGGPGAFLPTDSGYYEDTFVKTAAGWRLKQRIHTRDAVFLVK
jgi:hypothetical protein